MFKKISKVLGNTDAFIKYAKYGLFFSIIVALFVGFKMQTLIGLGTEYGTYLKISHTHGLLNAFLLLFVLYDYKFLHQSTGGWSDKLLNVNLGLGIIAHYVALAGFLIGGLIPKMMGTASSIVHLSLPFVFMAVGIHFLVTLIREVLS